MESPERNMNDTERNMNDTEGEIVEAFFRVFTAVELTVGEGFTLEESCISAEGFGDLASSMSPVLAALDAFPESCIPTSFSILVTDALRYNVVELLSRRNITRPEGVMFDALVRYTKAEPLSHEEAEAKLVGVFSQETTDRMRMMMTLVEVAVRRVVDSLSDHIFLLSQSPKKPEIAGKGLNHIVAITRSNMRRSVDRWSNR
jgi:hypothetical protein